ncbi:MAG: hypothetical protein H7Y38_05375 [Armatimonadetes bacterium]|nr:hypothetical protein [Armatimonadota bacterium]
MRQRPTKTKLLFDNPDAEVLATDDGEQIDNTETGGLTGKTFVLGGGSAKKRKTLGLTKLTSGAATAAEVLAKASAAEDELLPLLPLPGEAPASAEGDAPQDEEADDLLALVAGDAAEEGGETVEASEKKTRAPRKPKADPQEFALPADNAYRFPFSKTAIEILPDMPGTFALRVSFARGKTLVPLFQTTPLRAAAEIRCRGQHFPVALLQHARRKRDGVVLGAKRKTAKSWRAAVRCGVAITGREDRFTWLWRVTATAPALAVPVVAENKDRAPEAVCLQLPFAPGAVKILTLPGAEGRGLVARIGDVAVSVVAQAHGGTVPLLSADALGVYLSLENADLGGTGTVLAWQTWFAPAKTDAEAVSALAKHLAEIADATQAPPADTRAFLRRIIENAERELMRNDLLEKRGVDKNVFRIAPHRADMLVVGSETNAAITTHALVNRFRLGGEELVERRARLLANGVCEFQNTVEDSPHWGAIWDALVRKTEWGDENGKRTISFTTTARTARGLQLLHNHFQTEMYERTALAAAQWILLRLDRDGLPQGERFGWDGKAIAEASPWLAGEALLPLLATFRANQNDVFFKTALRIVATLSERFADFSLSFDTASTADLAALTEGVLLVSQEYERPHLIAFAREIGQAIRSRRLQSGAVSDPTGAGEVVQDDLPLLAPTLAGGRAALALSRVDDPLLWTTFALRAVRAVDAMLKGYGGFVNIADRGSLMSLATGVLLAVAARATGGVADWDAVTLKRDWQTFSPDPAAAAYVKISAPDGGDTPDYLLLVCPATHQVLIAVLAPPGTGTVEITKNGKRPVVRNLLSGELSATATLVDLEPTGTEGRIGVFIADT